MVLMVHTQHMLCAAPMPCTAMYTSTTYTGSANVLLYAQLPGNLMPCESCFCMGAGPKIHTVGTMWYTWAMHQRSMMINNHIHCQASLLLPAALAQPPSPWQQFLSASPAPQPAPPSGLSWQCPSSRLHGRAAVRSSSCKCCNGRTACPMHAGLQMQPAKDDQALSKHSLLPAVI